MYTITLIISIIENFFRIVVRNTEKIIAPLIKPRDLRDLAVIISTCRSKDNAELNRIPRSEILSTVCTPLPCSAYWKGTDSDFFLWNVITLNFEGLIGSPFSNDQVQTESRSCCNFSTSETEVTEQYNLMSSHK